MPLSEKELDAFLREQPQACEAGGLCISQALYKYGRCYRDLSLGPYGVAQQANVCFEPSQNRYYVQVVLSTSGAIGARLYLRAKQQLSALKQLLGHPKSNGLSEPHLECVLIGRRVETVGNFVYAFNLDFACQAFIYRYDATGLKFQQVARPWGVSESQQTPQLQRLSADLIAERAEATTIWRAARPRNGPIQASNLVVTADGVINTGEGRANE